MKVTDLRLGNLVRIAGSHYKVLMLGERKDLIKLESVGIVAFKSVKPIPLNEEWLLKFGFKREGLLTMGLDKFTCCCEEDYIDNFCLGDIDLYDVVPKYVHQLQNLYFALTGEELTIK